MPITNAARAERVLSRPPSIARPSLMATTAAPSSTRSHIQGRLTSPPMFVQRRICTTTRSTVRIHGRNGLIESMTPPTTVSRAQKLPLRFTMRADSSPAIVASYLQRYIACQQTHSRSGEACMNPDGLKGVDDLAPEKGVGGCPFRTNLTAGPPLDGPMPPSPDNEPALLHGWACDHQGTPKPRLGSSGEASSVIQSPWAASALVSEHENHVARLTKWIDTERLEGCRAVGAHVELPRSAH